MPGLLDDMDHGLRERMPGYPEYAAAAIRDLFPTPMIAAAALSIPGLSDVAGLLADIDTYRRDKAKRTAANFALTGLGLLPFVPAMSGIIRAEKVPKISVPAYRALRVYPGDERFPGVYPAMVGKDKLSMREQIPLEEWLKSEFKPFGMKARKGWHAGTYPRAKQFDLKREEYKGLMPPDMVWSDVSMGADLDLSNYLKPSEQPRIYHRSDVPFADPSNLPEGGLYLYSNRVSDPPWIVSDYVKHNRILTDEEVEDILRSAGLDAPPKRYGGPWTDARLREYGLR